MKRSQLAGAICIVSCTLFAVEAFAAQTTLTVAKDEVKLVESTNTGDDIPNAMEIHGELRLQFATSGNYNFYVPNTTTKVTATLGGDDGDQGRITLVKNANLTTYQNNSMRGSFVLKSPTAGVRLLENSSLKMDQMYGDKDVAFDEDAFEALEIGTNCFVQCCCCYHKAAKPMRIRFKGPGAKWYGWSYGSCFFETGSGGIELIGQSDSPIWMESANGGSVQNMLASWSASVTFKGDCDVRFVSSGVKRPICLNKPANAKGGINFQQTGDIIFSGPSAGACTSLVSVVNTLCYGPATGNIVVESNVGNPVHTLDFTACSQKINGLDLQNGSAAVSSTGAATLTFGTDDADGVLNGTIDDENLTLVKVGTGTLAVTNATTLRQFDLQAGTLLVDGVTLTCPALTQSEGANIVCVNGGKVAAPDIRVEYRVSDGLGAQDAAASAGQGRSVVHSTSGTGTLLVGGTLADVTVSAGTLRIGGELNSDKYWRFVFTEANSGSISTNKDSSLPKRNVALALNRIHLFSVAGEVTDLKLANKTVGTSVSALTSGSMTTSVATFNSDGISSGQGGHYRALNTLTYSLSDYWYNGVAWDAPAVTPDDELSWISVTMRRRDESADVTGYHLVGAVNTGTTGIPMQWKVLTSADGETWTVRDIRSVPTTEIKGPQVYSNNGVTYLLGQGRDNWSFTSTGTVSVASGAVLNLSEIPTDNIAIGKLQVDLTAGAGKITQFVPAANGEMELVNVPSALLDAEGDLERRVVLPLTFDAIVSPERLSAWTVTVNGKASAAKLRVTDGRIVARRIRGFALIVR